MDEIAGLVREIGHQQVANSFYKKCHSNLKSLQDTIVHLIDDLQKLNQRYTEGLVGDFRHTCSIVEELRIHINEISDREKNALLELESLYNE